jgi:tetratricopeptide (TPR) repeat protein
MLDPASVLLQVLGELTWMYATDAGTLPNSSSAPGYLTGETPDLSKAYAAACRTLAEDPSNIAAYFTRGVVCQGQRRYAEALADFTEVLRRDRGHARAWLLVSEVLASLGAFDKAKTARQEALGLDPNLS